MRTKKDLPEYTAYITGEYYKNNIQPFLDAFSENCLWLGPAHGQIIRTKQALKDTFAKETHQLTFSLRNLQIIPIPVNSTAETVLLTYQIITHYPDGESLSYFQRLELLWVEEKWKDETGKTMKDYFIRICHISNEFPYDSRDGIYPNHLTEDSFSDMFSDRLSTSRISLRGRYNSSFYLNRDSVTWLECRSSKTLIHTINNIYESAESLKDIIEEYGDFLIRVHSGYAVNPMYIKKIGRFYVEMEDGTQISIPEKKYTKTRDTLNTWLHAHEHPL